MRAQLTAPSWFDRFLCGVLHEHATNSDADGTIHRKCLTLGCGMLVLKLSPLRRLKRRSLRDAQAAIRRGA